MSNQVFEFNELSQDIRLPDIKLIDVCPILAEIVSFIEKWGSESYEGYCLPCALGLVSIISARRVEYLFGRRKTTNLYIMLVDTSGLSAKTSVLDPVQEIFKALDLNFLLFPDTITAQKLFSSMCIQTPKDFYKKDIEEREKIIKAIQKKQAFIGQRGWIYDEFGKLIREMMQPSHYNSSFRELLKKFYDNKSELGNSTHKRDVEVIHNPFLTLLGGMTPDDLSPYAQKGSALWRDGFLSRIAFICPPENFRKDKQFPDGEMIVPQSIVKPLREFHERLGTPQIQLTPEIEVIHAPGQLYEIHGEVKNASYCYRYALKDEFENSKVKDLVGNYIRYPDMALRIAVLIASLNNDPEVTLDQWAFAQNTTEEWRRDLHRLYYQSLPKNNSTTGNFIKDPTDRIYEVIKEKGPLTSREIQYTTHIKAKTVNPLIDVLLQDGKIKRIPSGKTFKFMDNHDEL